MTALHLFDRSDWGCIRLTGADRVRFLHNQTTNNIEQLKDGQGGYTVFVTSTGRTIDLASVYALPDSLLLTVSPGMAKPLYEWMDRYIFFSDKVTLSDESEQYCLFTLLGDGVDAVMQAVGSGSPVEQLVGQDEFSHTEITLTPELGNVRVMAGSDLAMPGYTFMGSRSDTQAIQQALLAAGAEFGAQLGTAEQWEALRIRQGRPMPHHELTDDDNPLEAGLWNSVSFEKGCYIGQETIARLNTYKGVKKRLWGIELDALVEAGTPLTGEDTNEDAKIGQITSVTQSEAGTFGLAYVRTKAGGEGLSVKAGDVTGKAVALPFVRHEYYTSEKE